MEGIHRLRDSAVSNNYPLERKYPTPIADLAETGHHELMTGNML